MLDASTGARSGAGRQGVAGTGGRKPERGTGWWVGCQGPRARGASVLGLHPGSMHPQGANCTPFAWAVLVCSPGALGDCNCANEMARKSKKSVCSLSFVPCWPRSWCPRRQDVPAGERGRDGANTPSGPWAGDIWPVWDRGHVPSREEPDSRKQPALLPIWSANTCRCARAAAQQGQHGALGTARLLHAPGQGWGGQLVGLPLLPGSSSQLPSNPQTSPRVPASLRCAETCGISEEAAQVWAPVWRHLKGVHNPGAEQEKQTWEQTWILPCKVRKQSDFRDKDRVAARSQARGDIKLPPAPQQDSKSPQSPGLVGCGPRLGYLCPGVSGPCLRASLLNE